MAGVLVELFVDFEVVIDVVAEVEEHLLQNLDVFAVFDTDRQFADELDLGHDGRHRQVIDRIEHLARVDLAGRNFEINGPSVGAVEAADRARDVQRHDRRTCLNSAPDVDYDARCFGRSGNHDNVTGRNGSGFDNAEVLLPSCHRFGGRGIEGSVNREPGVHLISVVAFDGVVSERRKILFE